MNRRFSYRESIAFLVAFVILSASRDIVAHKWLKGGHADPYFLTFFASAITFVFAYIAASWKAKSVYRFEDLTSSNTAIRFKAGLLNIGTVVNIATAFLALKFIDPFTNSVVDYGLTPLIAVAAAVIVARDKVTPLEIVGMVLSSMAVIVVVAKGLLPTGAIDYSKNSAFGYVFAFACSVSFAFNQIWTRDLVQAGIVRERVLVVRSVLPTLLLGLYCLFFVRNWSQNDLLPLAVLSVAGVTVPLLMLAYAFERLKVTNISYFLFAVPVLLFFGSWWIGSLTDQASIFVSAAAGVLAIGGVVLSEWASSHRISKRQRQGFDEGNERLAADG